MSVRRAAGGLAADDLGMVSIEGAYAIAAIVLVVILGVGAVTGVTAQIRCTDAAREVARLVAAGDTSARDVGSRLVGSSARISVGEQGERIVVDVSAPVPLIPGLSVSARAVAAREPDGSDQVDFAPGVGR
ncbi:hypothetical protein GCM10009624_30070 [Gordonia sinesedis]